MPTTRSFLAPSRGDFLFARLLVIVVALALTIGAVATLWPSGPLEFTASLQDPGPAYAAGATAPGASATYAPEVVWTLTDPSIGERLLAGLPALFLLVVGLVAAWLVWKLISAAQSGEPFTRTTVRYSRALAALVLIGAAIWPFLLMGVQFALVTRVQSEPSVLMWFTGFDFLPIVIGALLVILTEVYARGLDLRDDVEGLV
ncbi:DUF2975 domain-containing protein [Ammonicoccus fulvus]|uniref:DUF2975 domain-containing protein n=1 Tax=Ammonicoccus fulvus TaxID=3138240 RepID=A0ABZ3FSX3_9ACTN